MTRYMRTPALWVGEYHTSLTLRLEVAVSSKVLSPFIYNVRAVSSFLFTTFRIRLLPLNHGRHVSGHHKSTRRVGEGDTLRAHRSLLMVRGENWARSRVIQKKVRLVSIYIYPPFLIHYLLSTVKKLSLWLRVILSTRGGVRRVF